MDSISKLGKIKFVEAVIVSGIDLCLAIFGFVMAFISMFADPSWGWREFFLANWILFTIVVVNIVYAIVNGYENRLIKKIKTGIGTIATYEKRFKVLAFSQMLVDAIIIGLFFLLTMVSIWRMLRDDYWQALFILFVFCGSLELFTIANLVQNILVLKKIKDVA